MIFSFLKRVEILEYLRRVTERLYLERDALAISGMPCRTSPGISLAFFVPPVTPSLYYSILSLSIPLLAFSAYFIIIFCLTSDIVL